MNKRTTHKFSHMLSTSACCCLNMSVNEKPKHCACSIRSMYYQASIVFNKNRRIHNHIREKSTHNHIESNIYIFNAFLQLKSGRIVSARVCVCLSVNTKQKQMNKYLYSSNCLCLFMWFELRIFFFGKWIEMKWLNIKLEREQATARAETFICIQTVMRVASGWESKFFVQIISFSLFQLYTSIWLRE